MYTSNARFACKGGDEGAVVIYAARFSGGLSATIETGRSFALDLLCLGAGGGGLGLAITSCPSALASSGSRSCEDRGVSTSSGCTGSKIDCLEMEAESVLLLLSPTFAGRVGFIGCAPCSPMVVLLGVPVSNSCVNASTSIVCFAAPYSWGAAEKAFGIFSSPVELDMPASMPLRPVPRVGSSMPLSRPNVTAGAGVDWGPMPVAPSIRLLSRSKSSFLRGSSEGAIFWPGVEVDAVDRFKYLKDSGEEAALEE